MKKALIVGINHYTQSSINNLSAPIHDANKITRLLNTHYSINGEEEKNFSCKTLLSSGTDQNQVTRKKLQKEIEALFKDDTVDTALFYFSGHGYENCLGGYLITQDAEQYEEGVSFNDVMIFANNSKIKEIIIILDCCMSGHLGNIPIPEVKRCTLKQGISILTSSSPNQASLAINKSSLFTDILCNALEGGSSDILGNVKITHLYEHVDRMLGAWDQRPNFKTNTPRLSVIRRTKPKIQISILKKLTDYFKFREYKYPLNPSFEPTEKQGNPENETIFGHLQKMAHNHLVTPLGEEHMYYAAINSKHCVLTDYGKQYWDLIHKNLI